VKIKSLHIADFNQFQNFSLDLTYPEGHAKAGEPLDKVCIIGQSGAGKTSLLNLINSYLITYKLYNQSESFSSIEKAHREQNLPVDGPSVAGLVHERYSLHNNRAFFKKFLDEVFNFRSLVDGNYNIDTNQLRISIEFTDSGEFIKTYLPKAYYFTTYNQFPFLNDINTASSSTTNHLQNSFDHKMFDLSKQTKSFWRNIGFHIKHYQELSIKKRLEISDTEILEEVENKRKEYQEWLSNNKNPLAELGEEFLDKILKHFNLRVKKDIEFTQKEDIGEIQFETLQGRKVETNLLSTGTNQIINTMIPLFSDKPKNALIFFDEPERSLYPDIQTKIVDFYTSLAPDSQFFFATHSQLVASSFDPWEIVELKFNEDGTVYLDIYFKGERHVDNYYIHPKLLRWDSILKRVFDLDTEGNEARREQLTKLATLESKLKSESQPLPLEEKKKVWEEYRKLAKLLDWKTQ
jgi:ABC-type lipoprotein export system ATPase subunit